MQSTSKSYKHYILRITDLHILQTLLRYKAGWKSKNLVWLHEINIFRGWDWYTITIMGPVVASLWVSVFSRSLYTVTVLLTSSLEALSISAASDWALVWQANRFLASYRLRLRICPLRSSFWSLSLWFSC